MTLKLDAIREQFPLLRRPAIFFDHPGETQIARQSIARINTYLLTLKGRHPRKIAEELAAQGIYVRDENYTALGHKVRVFRRWVCTQTMSVAPCSLRRPRRRISLAARRRGRRLEHITADNLCVQWGNSHQALVKFYVNLHCLA